MHGDVKLMTVIIVRKILLYSQIVQAATIIISGGAIIINDEIHLIRSISFEIAVYGAIYSYS